MKNILLIGFKASGKSTLGSLLASLLGKSFVDTDNLIKAAYTEKTGQHLSCRAIFNTLGEAGFRALENQVIETLQQAENTVIATGGGLAANAQNIPALKKCGQVVFIDAEFPVIEKRLAGVNSPLFSQTTCAELFAERRPKYREAADIVFPVSAVSPQLLVESLRALIAEKSK